MQLHFIFCGSCATRVVFSACRRFFSQAQQAPKSLLTKKLEKAVLPEKPRKPAQIELLETRSR